MSHTLTVPPPSLSSEVPLPLAQRERDSDPDSAPFLTIAIPHYKHRRYLEVVLQSLFEQQYEDFEILISDDNSPDDSNEVIPPLLQGSGREFRYYAQTKNLGYDGNVRFCLTQARGRYVFLLGNDDALTDASTLQEVVAALRELNYPAVAFTNYEDWGDSQVRVERAITTRNLGRGPLTALGYFRTFSFVSGLIYDRDATRAHETDKWDSSVFYQIYLACRILAKGGELGGLALSAVRKDVRLAGQTVPNYVSKWAKAPWSLQPRHTGLDSVARVTADAIVPCVPKRQRSDVLRRIWFQVYTTTYPHWLFEYRGVANWSFAVGVARDLWPGARLAEYPLSYRHRTQLWVVYWLVTFLGLVAPARLVRKVEGRVAQILRLKRQTDH